MFSNMFLNTFIEQNYHDMSSVENIYLVARTGRVAFDAMGDRLFAEYKVVNIQRGTRGADPEHVVVGNYSFSNVRFICTVLVNSN